MAEGMKSALELALERTDHVRKAIREEGLALSDAQRERLADLEREYSAKIAEKDVMLQAEMRPPSSTLNASTPGGPSEMIGIRSSP